MIRAMGLFFVIPATLLLTVSFFVLFVLPKTEARSLKVFGRVIVILLWAGSFLFFAAGLYTVATGRHPLSSMMHQMMENQMQMRKFMRGGNTPSMMRGQEERRMMRQDFPQEPEGDFEEPAERR